MTAITKVRKGKGYEWAISMWDNKGFLLGIHFDSDRKISKAQRHIIVYALSEAAKNLDALKMAQK